MKKILIILACLILSLSACASENENKSQSPSDQKENQENSAEPEIVPEGENDSTQSSSNVVGIDGTISGECFDISIVGAKWTDALETSLYTVTPEKEGNKLLCLIFSAKNTTGETENLGLFNAYINKQATLPITVVGGIDDAMAFVGAVASGMEMRAYCVWELPEGWEELQLNYFEASGPECKQYFVIHPEDIS